MIPRCSPERARICEAPLVRNALTVSVGMSLRFPVSRAFMIAFVFSLRNPMSSIHVCMVLPMFSAKGHIESRPVNDVNSPVA